MQHAMQCEQMGPVDVNRVSTLQASNIKGKLFQFVCVSRPRVLCGLGLGLAGSVCDNDNNNGSVTQTGRSAFGRAA